MTTTKVYIPAGEQPRVIYPSFAFVFSEKIEQWMRSSKIKLAYKQRARARKKREVRKLTD